MWQSQRKVMREAMIANPNQAVGFVSKVICYRKNWQQNAANDVDNNAAEHADVSDCTEDSMSEDSDEPMHRILKTIWQRDISAAKLILYRGK